MRASLILLAAALFALAFTPLSQAKVVVNGFGTPGDETALGGQFTEVISRTEPRAIAVNSSGNGAPAGTSYVVDGYGNRVERFSPSGAFQRLWGQNVIAATVNEAQRISVNASAGTYTLTFAGSTTDPIPFDAGSGVIQKALAALPSVGGGANVKAHDFFARGTVVTFEGALAATNQPQLSADTSQLTGTVDISTVVDGTATTNDTGTGFEICTVAADCQRAVNGGQLSNIRGVAVNQANGHVYVTDQDNHRVSEFDADGAFVRAWGWDVIADGDPNDTGTGFEICEVAIECQQGATGANGGEFNGGIEPIGYPVTDSSNDVWVPDPGNHRIQEFDSSGHFIAAYGYDVDALGGGGALETCTSTAVGACRAGAEGALAGQFGNGSPDNIALDSSGNVYALDPNNNRVQKFNPSLTTASDFGASTFFTTTHNPNGAPVVDDIPTFITSSQGGDRIAFSVEKVHSFHLASQTDHDTFRTIFEKQIFELNPVDGSVEDTSLVGAGILNEGTRPNALGSDSAGNLYQALPFENVQLETEAKSTLSLNPRQVLVLSDTRPPDPVVSLRPIAAKATTATFAATVDPQGGLVSCKFQYSTDQSNWTDVAAPGCDSLASTGVQAVSREAVGLVPNTHYFLRLQVSRPLLANSTVTSFTRSFDTDAVPPTVTDVSAIQVADTSARLIGTVNPRHSSTSYVFEYGTTPSLGSSTAPLALGAGSTPLTVSQVVGGLSKDTTYYYALVATNAFGSTSSSQKTLHTRTEPLPVTNPGVCSNDARRQEQSSTYLPDCRAYEMVSPPDKNQGGVDQVFWNEYGVAFAQNGETAAFCTNAAFGEPAAQQIICAPYLSKRTSTGWQTSDPFPSYCPNDRNGFSSAERVFLNSNLDRAALEQPESSYCPFPLIDPTAPNQAVNLYRVDLSAEPSSYDLTTSIPILGNLNGGSIIGGSTDFSHIVFASTTDQTPDSPPGDFYKIYDWERDGHGACTTAGGCISLVSKDTANVAFGSGSSFTGNWEVSPASPIPSDISASGDRIFFENGDLGASRRLYMRENDATTYDLSIPECAVPADCGASSSGETFVWANPAGDVALFLSCDKLTDASAPAPTQPCPREKPLAEDGAKLYRWDESAAPGHHLTDLSVDHEPADGVAPGAVGILGASDDGSVVYMVAGGQIVSGSPTGEGLKLYRLRFDGGSPSVNYLGPYASYELHGNVAGHTINTNVLNRDPNTSERLDHVTPDGQYLTITTPLALDPAADRDSDLDAYRWDEKDGWTCVSCQLPGVPSAGDVNSVVTECCERASDSLRARDEHNYVISDDGQRIFFSAEDALVPQDVNGEAGCPRVKITNHNGATYACQDIYEWHDGTLSLITSGTGSNGFVLIGATADGRDVAFVTRERLVGWDADNGSDIYDARVGGGFPEPPVQPAACEGEACRGQGAAAPVTTGAGTGVFEGPGNPSAKHQKAAKHHKGKKRHHKRAHKRQQRANHDRRAGR